MILIGQNARSVLWYVEKMVFGDKNSNLCLFDKIKSFDLKNIKSVFKNKKKKKKVFGFIKDQICFVCFKKEQKRLFKKRVSLMI